MALLRSLFSRRLFLPSRLSCASISTSKKSKDTLVFPDSAFPPKPPPPPKTVEDFGNVKDFKNWVSYGYDEDDYEMDRHVHKVACFCFITLTMVGGSFLFIFTEDYHNRNWNVREGYLELHRREKNGLPLVDKNLIDPALVELPSDEELGDTEIII